MNEATATVLYPTDFSDYSRVAFQVAGALAQQQSARLVVLHVNNTLGPMVAYGEVLAQLQPEEEKAKLSKELQQFQVSDPIVHVEYKMVDGEPAPEILRVAGEIGCDFIVLGTHGRTGLARLIMGSVAEQVLRKARCAVVIVRASLPIS
jgi:nucleotide-binding universal stress UspA family protein